MKHEVNLEDDDPRHVQLILDYLYQLDYNDSQPPTKKPPSESASKRVVC